MHVKYRHMLVVTTLLLSASCRNTDAVTPDAICPSDLRAQITPGTLMLRAGDTTTLRAAAFGCAGTIPLAATWSWSAADTTIVRVDPRSGAITARRVGTSDVIARSQQPLDVVALARISVQP